MILDPNEKPKIAVYLGKEYLKVNTGSINKLPRTQAVIACKSLNIPSLSIAPSEVAPTSGLNIYVPTGITQEGGSLKKSVSGRT
jgi:hypothetical protein